MFQYVCVIIGGVTMFNDASIFLLLPLVVRNTIESEERWKVMRLKEQTEH